MAARQMNEPLITIVGETASGKSSLALKIAKEFNGEIICADSWTVRKKVNIGTDKPSQEDRRLMPHHMIDIVDPDEYFSAAIYKDLCIGVIKDIYQRGKLPILVGGSGLYIDSVLFNYGFLDTADPKLRNKLNMMSLDQLIEIIKSKGYSLQNVDINNKRRLIRIIESNGQIPTKQNLRPNTLIIGLVNDNDQLKEKIISRVNNMFEQGLEKEVEDLARDYGWDCEALKGVGYKQWKEYFLGDQDIAQTKLKIISATNNLAKKQRTWFKQNKSIHWLKQPIEMDTIVDLATTKLSGYHFN